MNQRRQLIQATALLLLAPTLKSAQAEIALSSAINLSGRFRALSQRCAKAYAQIALDVVPDKGQAVLAQAHRLMNTNMESLLASNPSSLIAAQLTKTQGEIARLIKLTSSTPSKASLVTVSQQSNTLLQTANDLTLAYEATAKQASAKLVNLAGRQRMLSQRMAKNYFLISSGVEQKSSREQHDQIDSDRKEFIAAMTTLNNAPISTPAIRGELQLAQSQWTFYDAAIQKPADAESMRNIAGSSENLLSIMNKLTELYAAALAEALGNV
jgi:Type IV pili methyl-accepting chemotaxis transducer N-term